jgi:hypothetical protein
MNQQLAFATPRARRTDMSTAHEAANALAPGNDDLIATIRRWFFSSGPATAEECAIALVPDESISRWRRSTIVSGCNPKRSGLVQVATDTNQRGRRVAVLGLPVETTASI